MLQLLHCEPTSTTCHVSSQAAAESALVLNLNIIRLCEFLEVVAHVSRDKLWFRERETSPADMSQYMCLGSPAGGTNSGVWPSTGPLPSALSSSCLLYSLLLLSLTFPRAPTSCTRSSVLPRRSVLMNAHTCLVTGQPGGVHGRLWRRVVMVRR